MIKKGELRIGTFVTDSRDESNSPIELFGFGYDDLGAYAKKKNGLFIDIQLLMGIPLTEEWFERFGFKKLDKYTFVKNKFFIHRRKRGFIYSSDKVNIKHVHQLQNLYYALTGEELTLKEES